MQVILRNAEQALEDMVAVARQKSPSMRFVLMANPFKDAPRTGYDTQGRKISLENEVAFQEKMWLGSVKAAFTENVDDPFMMMFVCHDRDVVVLSRLMTRRAYTAILECPLLKPYLAPPSGGAGDLLEVGYDHVAIAAVVAAKKAAQAAAAAAVAGESLAGFDAAQARREMYENGVKSLSRRRAARKKSVVMIIDDDQFTTTLVKRILADYDVAVAASAETALKDYVYAAPDIVFLDIELPDMNGHEILKTLREVDPEAYVVMLSGNGNQANIQRAVQAGAKGFVGKPFNAAHLIKHVRTSPFVARKHTDQELA